MIYTELTKKALSICYHAHEGQADSSGTPYVFHPVHLAEQMDSEEEVCAALLHDVVEDSHYSLNDLKEAGFPKEVIEAVSLLTHDRGQPYMDYILKVRKNALATRIKLSDLEHNCDISRLNHVGPCDRKRLKKYRIARAILEEDREYLNQEPEEILKEYLTGRTLEELKHQIEGD